MKLFDFLIRWLSTMDFAIDSLTLDLKKINKFFRAPAETDLLPSLQGEVPQLPQ